MSAVMVLAAVWTVLALAFAVVLGRSIRLADAEESRSRRHRDLSVDGDRSAAALPGVPALTRR